MTYNPNIPDINDDISVDIPAIQTNFNVSNNIFGLDHFNFNNADIPHQGYHQQVSFGKLFVGNPSLADAFGIIFTKNDINGDAQLYYKSITGTIPITGPSSEFLPVSAGWMTLPGGIILAWGFTGSPTTITFSDYFTPNPFTNLFAAYVVGVTDTATSGQFVGLDNTRPSSGIYHNSGFDTSHIYCKVSTLIQGAYFLAIGN